jgi:hypothetical protein
MHPTALTTDVLLAHWLGHRRLTRRTIEAFPEEALFTYHAPGMRTFAAMVAELNTFLVPTLEGACTGAWAWPRGTRQDWGTKRALLTSFDEDTATLERLLPAIPQTRFLDLDEPLPGRREPVIASLLYFLDNEIHHRAQGFVYLRQLGVEPPAFHRR